MVIQSKKKKIIFSKQLLSDRRLSALRVLVASCLVSGTSTRVGAFPRYSAFCSSNTMPSIKVISSEKLYVSEPDPRWFGNEPNRARTPPGRMPTGSNQGSTSPSPNTITT